MMRKSVAWALRLGLLVVAVPAVASVPATPSHSPAGDGTIAVERWTGEGWAPAGQMAFSKNPSQQRVQLDAPDTVAARRIRLTREGATTAYLDAVSLGAQAPIAAAEAEGSLRKLRAADLDLLQLDPGRSVVLSFAGGEARDLVVVGRFAPRSVSRLPFNFPLQNTYLNPKSFAAFYSYPLAEQGKGMTVDGIPDEDLGSPLFAEVTRPGSGHPIGTTTGWLSNDEHTLYGAIDFVPDNTDEAEDYATLFVRTADGLHSFTVTDADSRWGATDFAYTQAAAYQHTVYEFAVPLAELGMDRARAGSELEVAFAAYGTVAVVPIIDLFDAPAAGQSVSVAACTTALDDVPFPGSIGGSERDMTVSSGSPVADVGVTSAGNLTVDFSSSAGTVVVTVDGVDGNCSSLDIATIILDLESALFDRLVLVDVANTGSQPIDVQARVHTADAPKSTYSSVVKTVQAGIGPVNIPFLYATDFPGLGDLSAVVAVELEISASTPGGVLTVNEFIPSMGSVPVELSSFTVEGND